MNITILSIKNYKYIIICSFLKLHFYRKHSTTKITPDEAFRLDPEKNNDAIEKII